MEVDTNIMIVGIPNVGKSSIIKALRKHYIGRRTGVGVGADPGFTKSVSNKIQVLDVLFTFLAFQAIGLPFRFSKKKNI